MTTSLDERLVESTTAALELYGVHLGRALGLYTALAGRGPLTAGELADEAGIDARYAREWLEQQAVAGVPRRRRRDAPPPTQRRYVLPEAPRRSAGGPDDAAHVSPLADMVVGIGQVLDGGRRRLPHRRRRALRHYGADFRAWPGRHQPAGLHPRPRRMSGCPRRRTWHAALTRPGAAHRRPRLRPRVVDPWQSPRRTRTPRSSGSTPTRLDRRGARAGRGGRRRACASSAADAAEVGGARARSTPCSSSRRCTTCPARSRCWPPLALKSLAEGGSVVVVDEAVRRRLSPHRATTWSG